MVFFLPYDHGLDFLHQLMIEFNQSVKSSYLMTNQALRSINNVLILRAVR